MQLAEHGVKCRSTAVLLISCDWRTSGKVNKAYVPNQSMSNVFDSAKVAGCATNGYVTAVLRTVLRSGREAL